MGDWVGVEISEDEFGGFTTAGESNYKVQSYVGAKPKDIIGKSVSETISDSVANDGVVTVETKKFFTFYADVNEKTDEVWTIKILSNDGTKTIKTYEIALSIDEKSILSSDICSRKSEMQSFYKKAAGDEFDITTFLPDSIKDKTDKDDWLTSNPAVLFLYIDKSANSPAAALDGTALEFSYKIDDNDWVTVANPFKTSTDKNEVKYAALLGGDAVEPYGTFSIATLAGNVAGKEITFKTTLIVDSEEVTEGEGENATTTTNTIKTYTSTVTRTFGVDLF